VLEFLFPTDDRDVFAAGQFRRVAPPPAMRGFRGLFVYHFLSPEMFGGRR